MVVLLKYPVGDIICLDSLERCPCRAGRNVVIGGYAFYKMVSILDARAGIWDDAHAQHRYLSQDTSFPELTSH